MTLRDIAVYEGEVYDISNYQSPIFIIFDVTSLQFRKVNTYQGFNFEANREMLY